MRIVDIRPTDITTVDECDKAIAFVVTECARIEMQLMSARGAAIQYGEYSESGWFARANAALKLARWLKQRLAVKRSELGKAVKASERSVGEIKKERLFIEVAKAKLPREVYLEIWDQVDSIMRVVG